MSVTMRTAAVALVTGLGAAHCFGGNDACSSHCLELGACTPCTEQNCCVDSADDCKREACAYNGRCHMCTEHPDKYACTLRRHICIPLTNEECKASTLCKREGLCTLNETKRECLAGSDEDCKQSEDCANKKHCKYSSISGACF